MMITNAATAGEFCVNWIRNGSARRARRYIEFALDGQLRIRGINRSYRRVDTGNLEAIEVLIAGVAEAARLVGEK